MRKVYREVKVDIFSMYVLFRELEVTWSILEFDYSLHDRTGIKLPKVSEEVVEVLEDNQV